MRIFIVVMIAILTGVALGYAATVAEFGWTTQTPRLDGQRREAGITAKPRLVIAEQRHSFGRMFQNETREHTFLLRNEGLADLKIVPGKPSCKCTVSKVSRKTIPSGQTAEVTLTWKTGKSRGKYHKSAPISTNDPSQPKIRLEIQGTVTPEFGFKPATIFASSLSQDKAAEFESKLYFYSQPDVKIRGDKMSDPGIAEKIAVQYEPIPDDQIREAFAVCGYTIRVKILPGMDFGNFNEAVLFETEPSMNSPVRLKINGTVRKPVNIFGPHLDRKTQTLNMGDVAEGAGKRMRLILHSTGKYRERVQPKLKESTPPGMQLEVGSSQTLAGGAIRQLPLVIVLPETAPAGDYSGPEEPGRIVLETDHPDFPEIVLNVRLKVSPQTNLPPQRAEEKTDP
jgi:hypothetical protein